MINILVRTLLITGVFTFLGVDLGSATSQSKIDDQKLLCARIGMATLSVGTKATLPLDHLATEGGSANVYVNEDYVRIEAGLLFESMREHMDFRFHGEKLICAESETTSIWTIEEQTKSNPDGRPPFWRKDFRLYKGTKVIHESVNQAPGDDNSSRDAKETKKFADKLRALAKKELKKIE